MHTVVFFSLALSSIAFAEEAPRQFDTLVTLKGKTYESVDVKAVTPSGLRILHSSGAATILFEDLPEKIRGAYGYDRQTARAHLEKTSQARSEREQKLAAFKRAQYEKETALRKHHEAQHLAAIESGTTQKMPSLPTTKKCPICLGWGKTGQMGRKTPCSACMGSGKITQDGSRDSLPLSYSSSRPERRVVSRVRKKDSSSARSSSSRG